MDRGDENLIEFLDQQLFDSAMSCVDEFREVAETIGGIYDSLKKQEATKEGLTEEQQKRLDKIRDIQRELVAALHGLPCEG